MLQFGSKHVCIEDVHIFKHCREMTLFLLWIGTYCISCVVQQTSGVKDLSSLVRYDDSSLAAIRHVQSNIPVVRPRPDIRSHSVLFRQVMAGSLVRQYTKVNGSSSLKELNTSFQRCLYNNKKKELPVEGTKEKKTMLFKTLYLEHLF